MRDVCKVLFLCRDNAALSIMAEALLREIGGSRFEAYSAGWEPAAQVDRMALAELRPGISATHLLNAKSWHEFTGEWAPRLDVVVLCDAPPERTLPAFPGAPAVCRWDVDTGFATARDVVARTRALQRSFWQLVRRVDGFCAAHGATASVGPRMPAVAAHAASPVLHEAPQQAPDQMPGQMPGQMPAATLRADTSFDDSIHSAHVAHAVASPGPLRSDLTSAHPAAV